MSIIRKNTSTPTLRPFVWQDVVAHIHASFPTVSPSLQLWGSVNLQRPVWAQDVVAIVVYWSPLGPARPRVQQCDLMICEWLQDGTFTPVLVAVCNDVLLATQFVATVQLFVNMQRP